SWTELLQQASRAEVEKAFCIPRRPDISAQLVSGVDSVCPPRSVRLLNKKMIMVTRQQMELTFDASGSFRPAIRRQRRLRRARWWFEQMRQAVDRALDRDTAIARPEQIYFQISKRTSSN